MSARALLVCVGVTAAAATACNEDMLNPMADRQPRVQAYSVSDFYPDGRAMRAPPAGTVPRSRIVNNPAMTAGRPPGDEYVAKFPLPVDAALMKLGRKKYDITCGTCHGPLGDGDSIVAKQMSLRPPPSLLAYADKPPGYIFEVATNGFGLMASYAAELTVKERWAVVAYIRALQVAGTGKIDAVPESKRAALIAEPAEPATGAAKPAHKETP